MPRIDELPDEMLQLIMRVTVRAHMLTDRPTKHCRRVVEYMVQRRAMDERTLTIMHNFRDDEFAAMFNDWWVSAQRHI